MCSQRGAEALVRQARIWKRSWCEGQQRVWGGEEARKVSFSPAEHTYPFEALCFHGRIFQLWHLLHLLCLQALKRISQSLLMYRNLLFFPQIITKGIGPWGEQASWSCPQPVITSSGRTLDFDAASLLCMWGLVRGSPMFQKPKFCFPIESTWLRGSQYRLAKTNRRS